MRRAEEIVGLLLDELTGERRRLLKSRCLLDEARQMADELARRLDETVAGPEGLAITAANVRARIERLRQQSAEVWAERLGRWTELAEELCREIGRNEDLTRLGELSASVAHEIRNPLCGMLLSVEVLQTKMDADDSRGVLLDNLHREAEKMEKVVNNLLHFARRYQPRLVPCEMADVVARSIEAVKCHLKKKQMEVKMRCSALDCQARVDSHLLEQVFSNILLNSVDACPPGSVLSVDLTVADEPPRVAVAFTDEGEGIAGDQLDRIFEPFFTSKPNGIGLGLSVSKKIVEAHNGKIEVASETGKGTTFTVILPLKADDQHARAAA
jgi:signal transduction histidine kinase